jgi:hypothetical protein
LLRRRRVKVIQWAAMEFLQQSQKRQRRRLRIEELILLALRTLIVALAIWAFGRPVLRAAGIGLLSQNARVYAVIVLDNSFSMEHKGQDGRTAWQKAKVAADDVATKILRSGDSASLVLVSNGAESLVAAPSFDLRLIRRRIGAAATVDRATDYAAGAVEVAKLLKASKSPVKEVYWITDDQAKGWEGSEKEAAKTAWKEIGKQARLIWVSVGANEKERENLQVGMPALSRELVTPQLPIRINAPISNWGAQTRSNLAVTLSVDGKTQETKRVSVPAKRTALVQFTHSFVTPGSHTGKISLANADSADNLTRDNAAPFAVRTRERIRVLVQDMKPVADPAKSETFYLMNAMAPGGAMESLTPKLRDGSNLSGVSLRDYDVIVLAGVSGINAGDLRMLADYVKNGGGVWLFPSATTDPNRFNTDFQSVNLLPATLGARKVYGEESALTLNPASMTHSALQIFRETSVLDIGTARFGTAFPLEPATDANASAISVMARFSNGDPALIERKIGMGRVIVSAVGAGSSANQLPLKPAFVPFVYQIVSHLAQGAASRRNLAQNEPFLLTLPLNDANKAVKITLPDGKAASRRTALENGGVQFAFKDTAQSGIYKMTVDNSTQRDAFAVGLPANESDLTPAAPRDKLIASGVAANKLLTTDSLARIPDAVRDSRYGTEIWRPLIWILLPLLFLESLLAQRFGRRG